MSSRGWTLLDLAFNAPLVGIRKRWPNVLHAVDMKGLPVKTWPNGTATSVCGLRGLRVLSSPGVDGNDLLVLWPPRVAGLAPMTRCPECHEATGRKRPRSTFRRREAA